MAPRTESIHLPDFVSPDAGASPRVLRLAAFYGDLVRFASQLEPGRVEPVPIACVRRPGRKECGELLAVAREDAEQSVVWHCPACDWSGRITGWQATPADLRVMRTGAKRGLLEIAAPVECIAALRDIARDAPELGRLAFSARVNEAGEPVLLFAKSELERYASRLTLEALAAMGSRTGDRLLLLLSCIGASIPGRSPGNTFQQIDAGDAHALSKNLLELPDTRPMEYVPKSARKNKVSRRSAQRGPQQTFQIKVTLRDVRPPIWRRLLVPSDILLPKLHEVLQAAMGWYDSHLHLFRVGNRSYAPPGDWDPVGMDSRAVALSDLAAKKGARLVYEYDFGDGWTHDIVVESVSPEPCKEVRCVTGRRRCPPEDCGGPWGYAELLEALANPGHEEHAEMREWAGGEIDAEEFDAARMDAAVRRVRVK